MTTTIDNYVSKIIVNKYYEIWSQHPKKDKFKSFWLQVNELYIFDEVENALSNTRDFFTQEQINSIGWEERFEIIRYLTENITHRDNYDVNCYIDFELAEFQAFIYTRQWSIIFDKYALLYICKTFCIENNELDKFFEKVTNDFSVRTAIAKIKRNEIFILGLSKKLSMRDCGITLS